VGRVNLCSPDHISVLLHRTFNVSIPRHHIPTEQWEFEYGPAENDPEFGLGAQENAANDDNVHKTSQKGEEDGSGRWVHRLTHEKLGGEAAFIEFTVIGYFLFVSIVHGL
jgi:DNA-directed RNA polymerase I subunit RPA43